MIFWENFGVVKRTPKIKCQESLRGKRIRYELNHHSQYSSSSQSKVWSNRRMRDLCYLFSSTQFRAPENNEERCVPFSYFISPLFYLFSGSYSDWFDQPMIAFRVAKYWNVKISCQTYIYCFCSGRNIFFFDWPFIFACWTVYIYIFKRQ